MTSGLLVADVQAGITRAFEFCQPMLPTLVDVVDQARQAEIEVLFAVCAMRPSGADQSPRNHVMAPFFALADVFHEGGPGPEVDPRLRRRETEPVITKRRVSAFQSSELDLVLRSRGVTELAIAGIATSAVVLASALDAVDLDYGVTVLSDCCADPDSDVHEFLLSRVFPGRGVAVSSGGSWLRSAAE